MLEQNQFGDNLQWLPITSYCPASPVGFGTNQNLLQLSLTNANLNTELRAPFISRMDSRCFATEDYKAITSMTHK